MCLYKILYPTDENSKIQTLFPFRSQKNVIRAGIHKVLVRIANREDSDQTASSALFV